MSKVKEDMAIILPEDGIINTEWAREQLERAEIFSSFSLNANKGRVFFMLQSNLSQQGFEQSVGELEYTVETALLYIRFLNKLPVLEAIKDKYFTAISLSASDILPDTIEEAMALIDVCLARVGKPTLKNLLKALEITGASPKALSSAAISVEAMKKKALNEWLLSEHSLSEDDIHQAQHIKTEGKSEFMDKMLQAYSLLKDWTTFYNIIAVPVKASNNMVALRFLADINDASKSIQDFLKSETANRDLIALKAKFESEVYPKISFEAETR